MACRPRVLLTLSRSVAWPPLAARRFGINDLWLAPATVAVGMYLLYDEVDWATFVGVGVMALSGPVNGFLFAKVRPSPPAVRPSPR